MTTRIAAIIPARMASSRFPGKPLLNIEGLPMIEHVRRRTLLCKDFSDVVVATCDEEIRLAVTSYGGRVVMTSSKHRVATERIIEAMHHLDCTHVVNVQGDEILILPSDLSLFAKAMAARPREQAWNAVAKVVSEEELEDRSVVNCALSKSHHILFFSRNFSPSFYKNQKDCEPIFINLGILGYSRRFLEKFLKWEPTPLEERESVEQFRMLENDIPIAAVPFEKGYPGINEPREVEAIKKYLRDDPRQHAILKEILK